MLLSFLFTNIQRISDEKRRVDHIKARVGVCKSKVSQVRGSKKATTVFSTAKFPAPKLLPSYPTLFGSLNEVSPVSYCFLFYLNFLVLLVCDIVFFYLLRLVQYFSHFTCRLSFASTLMMSAFSHSPTYHRFVCVVLT